MFNNRADSALKDVVIHDIIPGAFELLEWKVTSSGGGIVKCDMGEEATTDGKKMSWNIGTVARGERIEVTYEFKGDPDAGFKVSDAQEIHGIDVGAEIEDDEPPEAMSMAEEVVEDAKEVVEDVIEMASEVIEDVKDIVEDIVGDDSDDESDEEDAAEDDDSEEAAAEDEGEAEAEGDDDEEMDDTVSSVFIHVLVSQNLEDRRECRHLSLLFQWGNPRSWHSCRLSGEPVRHRVIQQFHHPQGPQVRQQ